MGDGKRALLVIDMLHDFIAEGGKLEVGPGGRRIVPEISGELERFRGSGEPVIFICDRHSPEDEEFRAFPPHCIAGTPGAQVYGELEVREGEILIPKRRFSAFYGTDLDLTLRELGVKTLVLTGVCTNICILYTAADATMRTYGVEIIADAVASFDENAHKFALKEMEETLGAIVR